MKFDVGRHAIRSNGMHSGAKSGHSSSFGLVGNVLMNDGDIADGVLI